MNQSGVAQSGIEPSLAKKIEEMGGDQEGVWRSSNGRQQKYEDMDSIHILNCIKKMEREFETVKPLLKAIADQQIRPLGLEDIVYNIMNHPVMVQTPQELCAGLNKHYTHLKEALAKKNKEKEKEKEIREAAKVAPPPDEGQVWF